MSSEAIAPGAANPIDARFMRPLPTPPRMIATPPRSNREPKKAIALGVRRAVESAGPRKAMAPFPSTNWSLIRRSGGSPSVQRVAFEDLARAYRRSIQAYFRARLGIEAAEDATQSFLATSFEHSWWSRANEAAGSFRGFLLLLMRRHAARALDPLPASDAAIDQAVDPTPACDAQFDARFALELTARAVTRLREHYRQRGRAPAFDALLPLLGSPPEHGQLKHIAASLELAPNTLTVELTRLRSRLRDALRDELRELCADEAAFESEWADLRSILGSAD